MVLERFATGNGFVIGGAGKREHLFMELVIYK